MEFFHVCKDMNEIKHELGGFEKPGCSSHISIVPDYSDDEREAKADLKDEMEGGYYAEQKYAQKSEIKKKRSRKDKPDFHLYENVFDSAELELKSYLSAEESPSEPRDKKRGRGRPRRSEKRKNAKKKTNSFPEFPDQEAEYEVITIDEEVIDISDSPEEVQLSSDSDFEPGMNVSEWEADSCSCSSGANSDDLNNEKPKKVKRPHKKKRPKEASDKEREKRLCFICGKILANRESLATHMHTHNPNRPRSFRCNVCGRKNKSAEDRDRHVKEIHGPDPEAKTIPCKRCDEFFKSKALMYKHRARVHEGLKFTCQYCDKKFLTKEKMECHVGSIHGGARPYICDFCGKAYSQKVTLTYHLGTHSENTKPYKCGYCDTTYTYKYTMLNHIKSKHDALNLDKEDVGTAQLPSDSPKTNGAERKDDANTDKNDNANDGDKNDTETRQDDAKDHKECSENEAKVQNVLKEVEEVKHVSDGPKDIGKNAETHDISKNAEIRKGEVNNTEDKRGAETRDDGNENGVDDKNVNVKCCDICLTGFLADNFDGHECKAE